MAQQPVQGKSNGFPEGQCTQYADERYHALTGFYVPFIGNAKDWSTNARGYGWTVSDKPVVPSIMCLQAGVQGADGTFGHVGVVESVGANGTFTASNKNWGLAPWNVAQVPFHVGPGVSFIYATDSKGNPLGGTSGGGVASVVQGIFGGGNGSAGAVVSIGPTQDITAMLNTLDTAMMLTNPFNVPTATTDSIAGVSFTDPVSYVEGFGFNIVADMGALTVRAIFLIVGVIIIVKIASNFIDFNQVTNTVTSGLRTAAVLAV